jgi:hypothetical protein
MNTLTLLDSVIVNSVFRNFATETDVHVYWKNRKEYFYTFVKQNPVICNRLSHLQKCMVLRIRMPQEVDPPYLNSFYRKDHVVVELHYPLGIFKFKWWKARHGIL